MNTADLFPQESVAEAGLQWREPKGTAGSRVQVSSCGRYHISEIPDGDTSVRRIEAWFGRAGDVNCKLIGAAFSSGTDARAACEHHYHQGGKSWSR